MAVPGRVSSVGFTRGLAAEAFRQVGPVLRVAVQSVVAPGKVVAELTVARAVALLAACLVIEVAAYSGYMAVTKQQALQAYRTVAARELPKDPAKAELIATKRLEDYQARFSRARVEANVQSVATLTALWFVIGLTLGADKHSWRGVFSALCLAGVTGTIMFLSQLGLGLYLGRALRPATLAPFVGESWPMGHFAASIQIGTIWWCGAFAVGIAHVWRLRYPIALMIVSAATLFWIAFGHRIHSFLGL